MPQQNIAIPTGIEYEDLGNKEKGRLLSKKEELFIKFLFKNYNGLLPKLQKNRKSYNNRDNHKSLPRYILNLSYIIQNDQYNRIEKYQKDYGLPFNLNFSVVPDNAGNAWVFYKGKDKYGNEIAQRGNFGRIKIAQNLITGKWAAVKRVIAFPETPIELKTSPEKKDFLIQYKINNEKKYLQEPLDKNIVENEIRILKLVGLLKGTYINYEKNLYHIFMTYFNGGSLSNLLLTSKVSFQRKLRLAVNIIRHLKEAYHDRDIIHRDIKLNNVMLKDRKGDEVALIDVSFATCLRKDSNGNCINFYGNPVGTRNYMAPEVLRGLYDNNKKSYFSKKSDIYSLGVLLYQLFFRNNKKKNDLIFDLNNKNKKYDYSLVPHYYRKKILDTIGFMRKEYYSMRWPINLCLRNFEEILYESKNKLVDLRTYIEYNNNSQIIEKNIASNIVTKSIPLFKH